MNKYEKLTTARFHENLAQGRYANATGARRAIGKADWSEKDKEKARVAVDAHFGPDKPTQKAAAKKVTAKTPGKKLGRPKGTKEKVQAVDAKQQSFPFMGETQQEQPSDIEKLSICDRAIVTTAQSLQAVGSIASTGANLAEVQKVVDGLVHLVDTYHKIAEKLVGQQREQGTTTTPVNGVAETETEETTTRTGSLFGGSFSH